MQNLVVENSDSRPSATKLADRLHLAVRGSLKLFSVAVSAAEPNVDFVLFEHILANQNHHSPNSIAVVKLISLVNFFLIIKNLEIQNNCLK